MHAQVRRLSDQQRAIQSEVSIAASRLQHAERDLESARATLAMEMSLREQEEEDAEAIKRELAEERRHCENFRREAASERDLRRRSDAQVGFFHNVDQ